MYQRVKRSVIAATVLLLLNAGPVAAGVNEWTATGPNADPVKNFAVPPTNSSRLYLLTEKNNSQSAFKSSDSGLSWSSINMWGIYLYGYGIDPSSQDTIYAGTSTMVLKSTNGGDSWNLMYSAPSDYYFNVFAVDPVNNSIVYTGTKTAGVMKSTNGGSSWSSVNNGMTGSNPGIIAVDPANNETVYTGTEGGLFKSTDGGNSWSQINSSLVLAFAIDPLQTNTLYLATGDGIFKSTDGGVNWFNSSAGLPDPASNGTNVIAINSWNSVNLYAGMSAGVYMSSNGGESWTPVNTGLTNTSVKKLAIDPQNPANLYAGTEGGFFKITFVSTGTLSLAYTKDGGGQGTVSSSPVGIHCTDNCTASFNESETVTLHATPAAGSLFMGWSGECSGTGDCTVLMDGNKDVSARFDLQ